MSKRLRRLVMTILIIIGLLIFLLLVGFLVLRFYPSIGKVPTKEQQKNYAEKTQYFYDGQFHNQNKVMVTSSSSDVKGDELVPKKTIQLSDLLVKLIKRELSMLHRLLEKESILTILPIISISGGKLIKLE